MDGFSWLVLKSDPETYPKSEPDVVTFFATAFFVAVEANGSAISSSPNKPPADSRAGFVAGALEF